MSKHTEGPWNIDHKGRICSSIEPMYQPCKNYYAINPSQTTEANARLIAAAPTMAAYLERKAAAGDAEAQSILDTLA